ncbi:MAG: hypothetical protein PVG66_14285 [Chromatiales bacterium]|jgi:hypothetical protein
MPYGPFKLEVSKKAQMVDYEALNESIKGSLFKYSSFDKEKHDLFMFLVSPVELLDYSSLSWREKRRAYKKADRVLVQLKSPSNGIEMLGIYPTTIDSSSQRELDLGGEVLFEVGIPKIFKLKVTSKLQNKIRSDRYELFASRTDRSAQWVFLKEWVKSGSPFEMQIFCQVPKSLSEQERHLLCDAQANQNGRKINGTYNAQVMF